MSPRNRKTWLAGLVAGLLAIPLSNADAATPKGPLPGIKSYNFSASPRKVRRLCNRLWKGRYWKKLPYYGCDEIKHKHAKRIRYRVTCLFFGKKKICALRRISLPATAGGGLPANAGGKAGGSRGSTTSAGGGQSNYP